MIIFLAYALFIFDNFAREFFRTKKKAKRLATGAMDKNSSLIVVAFFIAVLFCPLLKLLNMGNFSIALILWIGIAIEIGGIAVHIVAVNTLGKYYMGVLQTVDKQQIVKNGLYKYIRHPGYLGVLLLSVGFGLAMGNWIVPG